MTTYQTLTASLIGYGFGCIMAAYFIGRIISKIDIRTLGSNNPGASNVTTTLGWKYGIITALIDIFKGTFAIIIVNKLFPNSPLLLFITGAFVILGHLYPFYLGFKGGKGTASIIGVALGINFKIGLIIAAVLVIVTIVTDYIAIAAILMNATLVITTYLFKYNINCTAITVFILLLCLYNHRINIKRILNHTETGLRSTINRKKANKAM